MGFLSEAATADEGISEDEPGLSLIADTRDNDIAEEPTPAAAEPPRTEKVALPAKPSRRQAAADQRDAVTRQIADLATTVKESASQYQARLAESAAEIARLKGGFEALIPLVQQRQQQQNQAPAADPTQLRRDARKALDANNFDEYERLSVEANRAEFRAMIPQQQPAAQAGPPAHIQMLMMQYPAVVNAGERGQRLAAIEDDKLALMGVPVGPERFKKAFELASIALVPQQSAAFSQASRGALSGIPNARSSGDAGKGSGEPGIELTAYELDVARRCGMSKSEYAGFMAEAHPERMKNG